jgi:hypothetical protein
MNADDDVTSATKRLCTRILFRVRRTRDVAQHDSDYGVNAEA